jgi:hypothetical protein
MVRFAFGTPPAIANLRSVKILPAPNAALSRAISIVVPIEDAMRQQPASSANLFRQPELTGKHKRDSAS